MPRIGPPLTVATGGCAPSMQGGAAPCGAHREHQLPLPFGGSERAAHAGLNNIEIIRDRPIEVSLREIAGVKERFPRHAVIASLTAEPKRKTGKTSGFEIDWHCLDW